MLMRCSFGKAVVHSGWHCRENDQKPALNTATPENVDRLAQIIIIEM